MAASSSSAVTSSPCDAPDERLMLSFMRVPPMSLQPACSRFAPPSSPSFTQEAWMLGMRPSKAMRATEWMSTTSSQVGPGRDRPCRKMGDAMCTKGSGMNSVNPPVRRWISRRTS